LAELLMPEMDVSSPNLGKLLYQKEVMEKCECRYLKEQAANGRNLTGHK
jgi:hypothetical protein